MTDTFVDEGMNTEVAPEGADTAVSAAEGQVAEGSTETEAAEDYFNIEAHADQKVRIKVDGEEVTVPLAELTKGYQRQSDYTRKTQEVARLRQEMQQTLILQQALERDPQNTLRVLQAAFEDQDVAPAEDQFVDPTEQALRAEIQQLHQAIAPLHQERAMAQAQAEVQHLSQTYGSLFDENRDEVIRTAIEMGTDLDTAFRLQAFDLIFSMKQGEGDYAQKQAAAVAAKEAAKEAAAGVVSTGTSTSIAGAVAAPRKTNSLRDALMESARELNITL